MSRFSYFQRVFAAYLMGKQSHLTFWHGEPKVNENFETGALGEYYMPFIAKANYAGHYDETGIPMLDYHGAVGLQYNPIAIAQYGLGNYNLYRRTGDEKRKDKFLKIADWLVNHLEDTPQATRVWYHHFDWEYRDTLKAPWHSALAQGQGISVLVRAHKQTGKNQYLEAAAQAFDTFMKDVRYGGVTCTDVRGFKWFEETIVDPPTHILNGFMWAAWGVYDYFLHTHDAEAKCLWEEAVKTLKENISSFDVGFWSLYEKSGTRMKMLASPFYHSLHIVQLKVMHKLSGEDLFRRYAERWQAFQQNKLKRTLALLYKSVFKLLYY
jgi:heparosan-N-sulfate-glucuronate 5-epimerase